MTPRNKFVFAVYNSAGRHAALRRRVHRDELATPCRAFRRRRRTGCRLRCSTRRRRSGRRRSRAACCSRSASRWRCRPTSSSTSRKNGPIRHPAFQPHHQRADRGVEHGAERLLQRDLEYDRQPLLRHRVAQLQSRRESAVGLGPTLKVEPHGDMSVLTFVNNAAGVPAPSTASLRNTPYTRKEYLNANLGLLRAGQVDAHPRLTLTYGARYDYFNALRARTVRTSGGRFCRRRTSIRTHMSRLHAVLERLVDSRRRLVRSVRERQDRAEDICRQIPGAAGARAGRDAESARRRRPIRGPGPIATATARCSMRPATCSSTSSGRRRTSTSAIPGGGTQDSSRFAAPDNWEESVSVQHELFPRVSVTGGYYHRSVPQHSVHEEPRAESGHRLHPFTVTVPQTRTCREAAVRSDHDVQPEAIEHRGERTTSPLVRPRTRASITASS